MSGNNFFFCFSCENVVMRQIVSLLQQKNWLCNNIFAFQAIVVWQFFLPLLRKICHVSNLFTFPAKFRSFVCYLFLIAGIYPGASSKGGAHGSQSDDSTYLARTREICAVVFTSPLTNRLCSQLQELQELPTSSLTMWSSSKSISLDSRTGS